MRFTDSAELHRQLGGAAGAWAPLPEPSMLTAASNGSLSTSCPQAGASACPCAAFTLKQPPDRLYTFSHLTRPRSHHPQVGHVHAAALVRTWCSEEEALDCLRKPVPGEGVWIILQVIIVG